MPNPIIAMLLFYLIILLHRDKCSSVVVYDDTYGGMDPWEGVLGCFVFVHEFCSRESQTRGHC